MESSRGPPRFTEFIHASVNSSVFLASHIQDNDVLTDHICSHDWKHTDTTECCRSANYRCHYHLHFELLRSDETRSRHLLMSLLSHVANIFDNLQSKDSVTYVNVRSRHLELYDCSNLSSYGTGLDMHSHKDNKYNI